MQPIVLTPHPPKHVRLEVDSFDSAHECSFTHWVDVHRLVDEDELTLEFNDTEIMPELEPAVWN